MFIIETLKSIIYGIAEGITEWLPISSTATYDSNSSTLSSIKMKIQPSWKCSM